METTINTYCKFKEYKEKRVRELIRKYNVFLGMPWGLISVICCLLLCAILKFGSEDSYLQVALIFSIVFTILAIVKYMRSLEIQKVIYDCLYHLSDYERVICSKIEIDTLRKQMQVNNNEIERLQCLIVNLDLKCKIINKTLRINYRKSFKGNRFSMNNLDEYKKMIKNKTVLLQERSSYRELRNKYNAEKQLLETRYEDLTKRVAIIEKNVDDDKQMLKNIDEKLKSALESKTFMNKIFIRGILKGEIRLFFTDLVEVVSQIKIQ